MCHQDGLTPKFLNFKLANSSLKHSRTYKQCQLRLLKEEIKTKSSIISKQKKKIETVRNSIKKTVSLFGFAHLSCLFLFGNDSKLVKINQVHYKKLHALGKDSSAGTDDPYKVIFDYSSHKLSNVEKNVLARGLNFALPPVKLNYRDCLTPFELLFRDVTKLPVLENILERLKVDIKREALSSYHNYSFSDELNLSKEEHKALKSLSTNKDLIIQKSDKGNSAVLLNRNDYIKRMNKMFSDCSKFKKLDIKPGKEVNSLLQQEDRLINFLKKLKRSISDQLYKQLYPRGSQLGIMYRLSKIHEPLFNNFPKLRPILSAINTATYGWAKFFVPLLKCFTMNEYTLKDSFEFAKDITNQKSKLFYGMIRCGLTFH